jgi:hypothetical protein
MDYDRNTQLFLSLVNSFQMQAMMQLGKLKNPFTNENERDLAAAQISIDILDMIKEKTKNNLIDEEAKFLNQIIADLKLNYVEEKNKESNAESNGKPEITSDDSADNSEDSQNSQESEDTNNEKNNDTEKSEGE